MLSIICRTIKVSTYLDLDYYVLFRKLRISLQKNKREIMNSNHSYHVLVAKHFKISWKIFFFSIEYAHYFYLLSGRVCDSEHFYANDIKITRELIILWSRNKNFQGNQNLSIF